MPNETAVSKRFKLSLDSWAVWLALSLVLLVKLGVLPNIPW